MAAIRKRRQWIGYKNELVPVIFENEPVLFVKAPISFELPHPECRAELQDWSVGKILLMKCETPNDLAGCPLLVIILYSLKIFHAVQK